MNGTGLVTPGVIYGSGNGNGSFTGETRNNIEVGLRAKQRYPKAGIYNYDGNNTYTFDSTILTTNPADRSVFNFDWAINVDQDGTSGKKLSDFDYLLYWDVDKTTATSYLSGNPFASPFYFDHELGNNSTVAGGSAKATNLLGLLANMPLYNVAQQSTNLGFGFSPDPDAPGQYGFKFEVLAKGTDNVLASSEILVNVTPVPLPAALPIAASAFGLFGFLASRKRKSNA